MYNIGDIVTCTVTTIKEYGFFVNFGEEFGLVHISEIANEFVNNCHEFVAEGQTVDLKIIDIKDGKFSLSLKQV